MHHLVLLVEVLVSLVKVEEALPPKSSLALEILYHFRSYFLVALLLIVLRGILIVPFLPGRVLIISLNSRRVLIVAFLSRWVLILSLLVLLLQGHLLLLLQGHLLLLLLLLKPYSMSFLWGKLTEVILLVLLLYSLRIVSLLLKFIL